MLKRRYQIFKIVQVLLCSHLKMQLPLATSLWFMYFILVQLYWTGLSQRIGDDWILSPFYSELVFGECNGVRLKLGFNNVCIHEMIILIISSNRWEELTSDCDNSFFIYKRNKKQYLKKIPSRQYRFYLFHMDLDASLCLSVLVRSIHESLILLLTADFQHFVNK